MPITVKMPALSPTMTEGALAKWVKKEGDEVRAGDVLAEIETDKATMEVEAVEEGTLGKILVDEGTQNVAVNAPIALLLEEGEDEKALQEAAEKAKKEAAAAGEKPEEKAEEDEEKSKDGEKAEAAKEAKAPPPRPEAPRPAPRPSPAPDSEAAAAPQPTLAPAAGRRVFASPLARRLAKEGGLEIARLAGTGPRGRVVKADVEAALASGGALGGGGIFAGRGEDFGPAEPRLEAHTTMRRVIAERMAESKRTVPHFYVTVDCEIDALLDLRKQINEADETLKISVNDFVIRAAALALREVPRANAAWSDEGLKLYASADVSVAVATEGGLITPIVKSADKKGLAVISAEVKDLAARAREGKLQPHEYQGGTFTISNMGMYGVREFAAIINPPQACILAVGAGEERVVVRDGEIGTATMMTCTLSVDHRAVDGALGAEYLAAFRKIIERPVRLIL